MSSKNSVMDTLTAEDLELLFDTDNIQDGTSLRLLKRYQGVPGLCSHLSTDIQQGISTDPSKILKRESDFGHNKPFIKQRDSFLKIVWHTLRDKTLQILLVVAIVSLVIGVIQSPRDGWVEGVAIMIAVFIVVCVTATNDYMKDGQFIKLNLETNLHNVIVIRDWKQAEIPAKDLLVGDLICVSPGEIFPVDGILVRGNGLSIDESATTGESTLVKRDCYVEGEDCNPFLVSGGKVVEGNGMMIVCAVGSHSASEKQKLLSSHVKEEIETPMQERISLMARLFTKIGFVAGCTLALILIIYMISDAVSQMEWGSDQFKEIISAVILGITLLVIAIPEGLPLAVTLSMAYSILKMKEENIFVRHLKGCEVMGAATTILTDKTGTLTLNEMKVVEAILFDREIPDIRRAGLQGFNKNIIAEIVSRNSIAFINKVNGGVEVVGNRTEGALLQMIESWGVDYNSYRNIDNQIYQFAFNSMSKRMTTVYINPSDKQCTIYSKGAAEILLDLCEFWAGPNSEKIPLTAEKRASLKAILNKYSERRLRILGLAYKYADISYFLKKEVSQELIEAGLILVGFVGIEDPLRPEAKDSVQQVQRSGVIVRMVTGDKLETAVAIAKVASILPDNLSEVELSKYAIKGKHFRNSVGGLKTILDKKGEVAGFKVNDIDTFRNLITNIRVVARCSPEDKLLLVMGLKQLGEVVGVTGDGSNDAAALKQSDIGISMMSGTQLARESSDIILLDNNFGCVLKSIKWGRNVYASIRKFLQFLIAVDIVAVGVSLISSLAVQNSPLSAVQMLWVNLVINSFAALALASEVPSDDILDSKPFGRTENIITLDMWLNIITQSVFQLTVLLILLFLGPSILGIKEGWGHYQMDIDMGKHFTIFFYTFVMLQLAYEVNCRKLILSDVKVFYGFFDNWLFVIILAATFTIQVLIIEFGGEPFMCVPLSAKYHALCIGLGVLGLGYCIMIRYIARYIYQKLDVVSSRGLELALDTEKLIGNPT